MSQAGVAETRRKTVSLTGAKLLPAGFASDIDAEDDLWFEESDRLEGQAAGGTDSSR